MYKKNLNTSDSYVKPKEPNSERRTSNSGSHMIIKLAHYTDKSHENSIRHCCELNNSIYIPIFENKFGILNEMPWDISYGRDSCDNDEDFGVKSFIEIYKCAEKLEKQNSKYKFWKKNMTPYIGELLDNKFFYNVFNFIQNKKNIEINFIKYFTEIEKDNQSDNIDEIKEIFYRSDAGVFKISINFGGDDIIIDKDGFIDISSGLKFSENENFIKDILIAGYKGNYGQRCV